MQDGVAVDGTVAQDGAQITTFWKIREGITLALGKEGSVNKYDLSIPVPRLYDLVNIFREKLGDQATNVVGYGHMGDGNIHLNITSAVYSEKLMAQIEPFVYEWTAQHHGSISAEHGLGVMKAPHLHYSKSPEAIALMKRIKALFDPNGIMNPYKFLPKNV